MKSTDILAALPQLSAEQLAQIGDRCLVLRSIGPKKGDSPRARAGEDFARDLYEAVGDEMLRRTQTRQEPWHTFSLSSRFTKTFGPAARRAADANGAWFPRQSKAERLSMTKLYAELVLDYLAAQNRVAVWFNIAAAVSALPEIVDMAFPGYASSGLLGKVQSLRVRGAPRV